MDIKQINLTILPILIPRKPTYEKDYSRIQKKNVKKKCKIK